MINIMKKIRKEKKIFPIFANHLRKADIAQILVFFAFLALIVN